MSEEETNQEDPQTQPAQPAMRAFHEETIPGQGFTQYNVQTGWLWIGIRLQAFTFRSAWAFITSQEFLVSQAFDQIEQGRIKMAQMANAGKGRGVPMPEFVRKILKH